MALQVIEILDPADFFPEIAPFGCWRITKEGLEHRKHPGDLPYTIDAERLWEGPLSGGETHDSWEVHLSHKDWADYTNFLIALYWARVLHADKRPEKAGRAAK